MPLGMSIAQSYSVVLRNILCYSYQHGFCVALYVGIGQCEGLELRDVQRVQIPALFLLLPTVFRESGTTQPDMTTKKQREAAQQKETDIFVASMYFFVPLDNVSQKYGSLFSDSEKTQKVDVPNYIQDYGFICKYINISDHRDIGTCPHTFTYRKGTSKNYEISRNTILIPYLFYYYPHNDRSKGIYFLVIGTEIDKVIYSYDKNGTSYEFWSADDLVQLKQSLLKKSVKSNPLTHYDWLCKIVNEIQTESYKKSPSFRHSITEISTATVSNTSDYEEEFQKKFYSTNDLNDIKFTTEEHKFCYGILTGNENYSRLPELEVKHLLNDGYSNNVSEITFAAPNSIVFYKKRHPSYVSLEDQKPIKPNSLFFIQYIHEMCIYLYIKKYLKKMSKLFHSRRSAKIKEALSFLSEISGMKIFNVLEADRRVEYIYNAFGLKEEYDKIRERGNLLADAINIKYSRRINLSIIVLTIFTIILGIIQILKN